MYTYTVSSTVTYESFQKNKSKLNTAETYWTGALLAAVEWIKNLQMYFLLQRLAETE